MRTHRALLLIGAFLPAGRSLHAQPQMASMYAQASAAYCRAAAQAAGPERNRYIQAANAEASKARALGANVAPCNVSPVSGGAAAGGGVRTGAATASPLAGMDPQLVAESVIGIASLVGKFFDDRKTAKTEALRKAEAAHQQAADDAAARQNAARQAQLMARARAAATADADRAEALRREQEEAERARRAAEEIARLQEAARARAAADEQKRVTNPGGWFFDHFETVTDGVMITREALLEAKVEANNGRYDTARRFIVAALRILTVMQAAFPDVKDVNDLVGRYATLIEEVTEMCALEQRIAARRGAPPPACVFS